jgi:peptidoglycan/LPS O-acetylase OafA/YrhL
VKRFPALAPDSQDMLHLDALRAGASMLIVVFHFNRFLNLDGRWDGVAGAVASFSLIVDLFFVVSGYVISAVYADRLRTRGDFGKFLQRRVARLAPLHWATLLAFVLIALAGAAGLVNDRDPSRYDPACVLPNLLMLQGFGVCRAQTFNFVSWSISAEMGMYLILPPLFWIGRRGALWLAVSAAAVLAALFAAPGEVAFHQWTSDFGVLRALPGFLVGMLAFRLRAPLGRLPAARWWLWGACAAFLLGAWLRVDRGLLLFVAYAVGIAGVAADNAPAKASAGVRWLAPWGQLSYSLYMLHPLVLKVALNWIGFGTLHLGGDAMRLWCLAWGLALIPISYASLMLFERPARDWIARLGRKPAPSRP